MSIGQRISELRKINAYSQEYVAEKLGVSRQAVSKWETDASAPDTYNLIALSQLFGASVEYIATGKQTVQEHTSPPQGGKYSVITPQMILGFILLGTGVISLILGVLLSAVLILLSVYLLLGSILCLVARKRAWLVATWSFWILTLLIFNGGVAQNLFCIFVPSFYFGGLNLWMIISYIFWIWLVANITVTVIIVKKGKNK